jgi:hypothetical protein
MLVDRARRLNHVVIDPVGNRLVIDAQFARYRPECLPVEAQQDGFPAQAIGITIQAGGRGIFPAAGFTQVTLAAGEIPARAELLTGIFTNRALGHKRILILYVFSYISISNAKKPGILGNEIYCVILSLAGLMKREINFAYGLGSILSKNKIPACLNLCIFVHTNNRR